MTLCGLLLLNEVAYESFVGPNLFVFEGVGGNLTSVSTLATDAAKAAGEGCFTIPSSDAREKCRQPLQQYLDQLHAAPNLPDFMHLPFETLFPSCHTYYPEMCPGLTGSDLAACVQENVDALPNPAVGFFTALLSGWRALGPFLVGNLLRLVLALVDVVLSITGTCCDEKGFKPGLDFLKSIWSDGVCYFLMILVVQVSLGTPEEGCCKIGYITNFKTFIFMAMHWWQFECLLWTAVQFPLGFFCCGKDCEERCFACGAAVYVVVMACSLTATWLYSVIYAVRDALQEQESQGIMSTIFMLFGLAAGIWKGCVQPAADRFCHSDDASDTSSLLD